MKLSLLILAAAALPTLYCTAPTNHFSFDQSLRIASFNIEDIRSSDLTGNPNPRLIAAAGLIAEINPDILLINEMAYDSPGSNSNTPGLNGKRFVDMYLSAYPDVGYSAWMPPTNTGIISGFDLNNDGIVGSEYPAIAKSDSSGIPPRQTQEGRDFGNDSWGFGTFPGQYGMAIFVRKGLSIDSTAIQTFQTFRWADLPGALAPSTESGQQWYDDSEWAGMRLSSKNHVIVPVLLENGQTLNILASHPTPPAFDGQEMRNKKRNHDEIRLIAEIVNGNDAILSDQGSPSQIDSSSFFVIAGDLNADPDEGNSFENPILNQLFTSPRINSTFVPVAPDSSMHLYPNLDPDDTAQWGLRVDYVLPSTNLEVHGGGVYRTDPRAAVPISDHFPVYVDIVVPAQTKSSN